MINIHEYAQLCQHVYTPDKNLFGHKIDDCSIYKNHIDKIKSPGWYMVKDVDPAVVQNHWFYAALYVKYELGQFSDAVIAFRGTKDFSNKIEDILTFWPAIFTNGKFENHPPYLIQTINFGRKARDYVREYFPKATVSVTGHSLGGALAQVMVGTMGLPLKVHAFNSPGVANMPGMVENLKDYVFNYNSQYGFINKIGLPFGKVYYYEVADHEKEAKRAWDEFSAAKKMLEQTAADITDVTAESRLLTEADVDAMHARDDFNISWYPQHKLDNLIASLHKPVLGGEAVLESSAF